MAGAWELKKQNKVCCAIIHVETTTVAWALALRRLIIPGPEPLVVTGLPFDHARNVCARHALDSGAEWLFFLDSDVAPPPDAVPRLLAWDRPVISGMYCRRSPPHAVPVMMRDDRWVTDIPAPGKGPLVEVELVGAGCLLIHRRVLEQLPPHRPGKPWFDWRSDIGPPHCRPGEAMSEDFTFCKAVREKLNIPVMVDTSVRCRHIGMAEADYGSFVPLNNHHAA